MEQRTHGAATGSAVSQQLRAAGLKLSVGTIVDASIISAPSWIQMKERPRALQRQLGESEASLP
jgi:hypothetical protein